MFSEFFRINELKMKNLSLCSIEKVVLKSSASRYYKNDSLLHKDS